MERKATRLLSENIHGPLSHPSKRRRPIGETTLKEKRESIRLLGKCPHCKSGGEKGDAFIVALYWDDRDQAWRCVVCGYFKLNSVE